MVSPCFLEEAWVDQSSCDMQQVRRRVGSSYPFKGTVPILVVPTANKSLPRATPWNRQTALENRAKAAKIGKISANMGLKFAINRLNLAKNQLEQAPFNCMFQLHDALLIAAVLLRVLVVGVVRADPLRKTQSIGLGWT